MISSGYYITFSTNTNKRAKLQPLTWSCWDWVHGSHGVEREVVEGGGWGLAVQQRSQLFQIASLHLLGGRNSHHAVYGVHRLGHGGLGAAIGGTAATNGCSTAGSTITHARPNDGYNRQDTKHPWLILSNALLKHLKCESSCTINKCCLHSKWLSPPKFI